MLTSLTTDLSTLSSSSPRPSPYQHPHPLSTLSLDSNHRQNPMSTKSPRFYSSPVDSDPDSSPLQIYGLEQRPPSIVEKPKLLRRVSHALDDVKEDFSLQISDRRSTAHKIKRRSTLGRRSSSSSSDADPISSATGGPPRSRPLSIISFDVWSSPSRRLSRRLTRRLSGWSLRSKVLAQETAGISSPDLIGSSI